MVAGIHGNGQPSMEIRRNIICTILTNLGVNNWYGNPYSSPQPVPQNIEIYLVSPQE